MKRPILISVKGVGRHRDDGQRDAPTAQAPNAPRRLVPVHHRHLNIHQNEVVAPAFVVLHTIDGNISVFHDVDRKTRVRQNRFGNFLIEDIVFDEQNPAAGKVRGVQIRIAFFFQVTLRENVPQLRQEKRFLTERRHPGFARFLFNIRPIVSREDDDGPILTDDAADAADGFYSVHVRHQPVDDVGVKLIADFLRMFGADYGFFAGNRPLRAHADLREHPRNTEARVRVVIRHQHFQPLQ